MSRSGGVVKTKKGLIGMVYSDEEPINGKLRVHLLEYDLKSGEKIDLEGQPLKVLIKPDNLTHVGFFN